MNRRRRVVPTRVQTEEWEGGNTQVDEYLELQGWSETVVIYSETNEPYWEYRYSFESGRLIR